MSPVAGATPPAVQDQCPPALLSLCVRIDPHPEQQKLLARACAGFRDWHDLAQQAERHGMGPLLSRHLDLVQGEVPADFLRSLKFLCLRHRQANQILGRTLDQVLALLAEQGIGCLVLKGAALCRTLYPDPGLRPMRDIDLLLERKDCRQAHDLLLKNGFRISAAPLPDHFHHLPPLIQTVDGLPVCIELHHKLFPSDPPYYRQPDFKQLFQRAREFPCHGATGLCLADEDMLWHLFEHGFHAPLTYEPYKLISAADIISLVEQRLDRIDWQRMAKVYPSLLKSLPFFHLLTPWQDQVTARLPQPVVDGVRDAGKPYQGWPRRKFSTSPDKLRLLAETLAPPQWWLMLYYSVDGPGPLLWCRLVRHPVHILRWVRLMWRKRRGEEKMVS